MQISEETFLKIVRLIQKENPEWRFGQTLFNVGLKMFPKQVEQIRGTKTDPFYCLTKEVGLDTVIDRFLLHLFPK